jgi:glycine oxidase
LLRSEGIAAERLTPATLRDLEPALVASGDAAPLAAVLLPDEAQLRNPWHLRALVAACLQSGVTITANVAATGIAAVGGELGGIETSAGLLRARQFCFTAGAWTGPLLKRIGIETGILPIRGQMVLFHCQEPPLKRMVNVGSRYLVPRDDGRVLAGSTEEEVGFDKRTTHEAITDLVEFARSLAPLLGDAPIEHTWAGLRPGSFDGLPYLGPLPGLNNAFIAAGHFRLGLYLSPATAVVMSQLLRGERPQIDLAPFRVGR